MLELLTKCATLTKFASCGTLDWFSGAAPLRSV